MKVCYFDTIGGISGDMTLAAFVSAGFRFDDLVEELKKLQLPGFELEASHIERNGIAATKIDVVISEQPKYHRHYADICALLDASVLAANVKERAKKIFHEIAVAEAKVHNSTLEKIHFHEVGAIDSLVDIVGTAICLDHFHVDAVYTSPVKVGNGGFVNSQHGQLPIPTPATVEILKGYPIVLTDIPRELCTPTGAAIIKACSNGVLTADQLKVETVGYGAGTRELEGIPNVLRILIGEMSTGEETDEIVSIETNIDDMNPELLPYILEKLLAAGARDAYLTPVVMKKGRPGVVLHVIVSTSAVDAMAAIIFRESTSIGIRMQTMTRRKLVRSQKEVHTSLGLVKVKSVIHDGKELLIPEFEECRRIAAEKHLPLKDVYRTLETELAGPSGH